MTVVESFVLLIGKKIRAESEVETSILDFLFRRDGLSVRSTLHLSDEQ